MDFSIFKNAVAKQFARMQKHQLFRVDVEKDTLWDAYLASYPEGTNPMFRERTEHDCQCCRQFVRSVGDVVALIDGNVESIWDINIPKEPAYQVVADAMSALVKGSAINNVFLHYEKTAGTDKSFEQVVDNVTTWDHFFVNIDGKFVKPNKDIPMLLGEQRSSCDVFLRALNELTIDSIDTVLELIAQNSLYRGEEHKSVVSRFKEVKELFEKSKIQNKDQNQFAWASVSVLPTPILKIRNTVIGSLLVDLSEGKELEYAVKSFEQKVAPTNYKRPTAVITKGMIEKAKATIENIGLTSALERRYANINDITINNILFADRKARSVINGGVFDDLIANTSAKTKSLDKIEEVHIEKFLAEILPKIDSMEVMIENSQANNMVSLIAPVDPTAGNMFKWDNKFSWSYNGEMADSIKERVKNAGGSVEGDLCCRLAWDYTDDLDFHMYEPDGNEIYFGNRRQLSSCGGVLDLDANGGDGQRDDPAENIVYADSGLMKNGVYKLIVNNYNRRSNGKGFVVEIEFNGVVYRIQYDNALKSKESINVASIKYSGVGGFEIIESLPSSNAVKVVWNVPTNTFQKVNVMMMSPNFWDDKAVGNKHYFFMLENCRNDGTARGFFNEFLKESLNEHRKVLEVIGSKMKTESVPEQLSGIGFSATQRNSLICRVKGSFTRTIKILF